MDSKYKFIIVGGCNTAITFALYAFMVSTGFHYNVALTISYITGIVIGFFVNRVWTFRSSENDIHLRPPELEPKTSTTQFLHYLLVYALIFVINLSLLNLFVQVFALNPIFSQLISVGISTILSYYLQKSWVFKNTKP